MQGEMEKLRYDEGSPVKMKKFEVECKLPCLRGASKIMLTQFG